MIQHRTESSANDSKDKAKQYLFGITHTDIIDGLLLFFGFVLGTLHAHYLMWCQQCIRQKRILYITHITIKYRKTILWLQCTQQNYPVKKFLSVYDLLL
jgi:hypothetical protein